MKKNFPFFFALAALTLGLWSCNNAGSEAEMAKNETTAVASGNPLPAFQISADSAQTWMGRWVEERKDIVDVLNSANMSPDTAFLVYGYHLPRLELDSMLRYLGPDPDVWAMLAIKYDSRSQKFVPELVFAAEPNGASGDWSYYDFTVPCPTSCPDDKQAR
ncbi:MAG: hypothetical protein HUU01_21540 [Saprospiraceae bacterium]|nr:hypothetical protein [Saprospiraceae bacterium]